MNTRKTRLLAMLLALVMIMGMMASCTKTTEDETATKPESKPESVVDDSSEIDISEEIELNMYFVNAETPGWEDMLVEFNKLLKEELNCTLKVNFIGFADFQTKYPLVLSSGEPIDLIYASSWLNFYNNAEKGAFMPLQDIIPTYAPITWDWLSDNKDILIQASVNDNIYCIPSARKTYTSSGFIVRGDLMEKYNIPEFHDMVGYGEYLKAIKENEPGIQPAGVSSGKMHFVDIIMNENGFFPLSDPALYFIDPEEENPQVFTTVDWEGLPEFLELTKSYYEAGYWPSSTLSDTSDASTMFQAGQWASIVHNVDSYAGTAINNPDWDVKWFRREGPVFPSPAVQDTMAIPISAQNPERALMLIEKIRTEQKYWDLFAYGILGVHSNIFEDGSVEMIDPANFNSESAGWGLRTEELYRNVEGLPDDYEVYQQALRDDEYSNNRISYTGFAFNTESVKNEYAAVQSVMTQYFNPLLLGFAPDNEKALEELKQQMTAAEVDTVIAEYQRQLDEYILNYD